MQTPLKPASFASRGEKKGKACMCDRHESGCLGKCKVSADVDNQQRALVCIHPSNMTTEAYNYWHHSASYAYRPLQTARNGRGKPQQTHSTRCVSIFRCASNINGCSSSLPRFTAALCQCKTATTQQTTHATTFPNIGWGR